MYLYFDTDAELENRKKRKSRGGYIEVIKLINSVLVGLILYMLISYATYSNSQADSSNHSINALIALMGAILSWLVQILIIGRIYDQWYRKYLKKIQTKAKHE